MIDARKVSDKLSCITEYKDLFSKKFSAIKLEATALILLNPTSSIALVKEVMLPP